MEDSPSTTPCRLVANWKTTEFDGTPSCPRWSLAESSGDLALFAVRVRSRCRCRRGGRRAASGLVALRPDVVFRHPLVRAAVYGGAPKALRSRVHEKLAALIDRTDPERRVRHLAAAAREPDEALAGELELAGGRAAQRGGYAAEASVLLEAATLSPSPDQRARARCAASAFNAGLPQRVRCSSRPRPHRPVEGGGDAPGRSIAGAAGRSAVSTAAAVHRRQDAAPAGCPTRARRVPRSPRDLLCRPALHDWCLTRGDCSRCARDEQRVRPGWRSRPGAWRDRQSLRGELP